MLGLCLGSCVPNFTFTSLAILELLAFNAQKITGHMTLTLPPFRKFFSGVTSGLCLGSCMPNFKFAPLAILDLLAFNAQKIKGHVTLSSPPFCEFFSGVMFVLYLGSCMPYFKFAPLAILELCQISSKSVKNCDRKSARMHTQKCVGHQTLDIGHRRWFYILSNAAMHSIGQTIKCHNL